MTKLSKFILGILILYAMAMFGFWLSEKRMRLFEKARYELEIENLNLKIDSLKGPEIGGTESDFVWPTSKDEYLFPIYEEDYLDITSFYGYRISPTLGIEKKHDGVDITAVRGALVIAIADGEVYSHFPPPGTPNPKGGVYKGDPVGGGVVRIRHSESVTSAYLHLERTYVQEIGQKRFVKKGQPIGRVGNTGMVVGKNGGYHLHFEMLVNETPVNPFLYMKTPWETIAKIE